MKLVYTQKATTNNNGYTMKKIVSLVGVMLKNAETLDEFMNAFHELEDDLFHTDFNVFFGTGDDYGFSPKLETNWYFNVTNTVRGNEKTFDITKEIKAMD